MFYILQKICFLIITLPKSLIHFFFNFTLTFFFLNDRTREKVLLKDPSGNGLYKIHASSSFNMSHGSKAFVGERHSSLQWHFCMVHPSVKVINKVLRSLGESVSIQNKFKCSDCVSFKSKQLTCLTYTT